MEYTPAQIVQETSVTLRTIRLWASRKLVPPPVGRGRGTRYTEEHRFLIKVIKALLAQVHDLEAVRLLLKQWTREEQADLIGEGAEESEPEASPPPAIEKLGVAETPLPDGARWVIVELLPNLALMVGEDAAPLVKRVAAEICREYGRG